jgi:hypothetical protein
MIKPIVYRTIEEKELFERKLMAMIPKQRRMAASKVLMNIFSRPEMKKFHSQKNIPSQLPPNL